MGRLYEPWICNVAFTRESKLSQIKPSPSHHSSGITFSKQTLELVRFFERLPHQDASLKNTASLKKLLPS
jgi:hypothetical protein